MLVRVSQASALFDIPTLCQYEHKCLARLARWGGRRNVLGATQLFARILHVHQTRSAHRVLILAVYPASITRPVTSQTW